MLSCLLRQPVIKGTRGLDKIFSVKSATTELIQKALQLPAEARAALAGVLIESLDETVDESAEEAWAEEITRRIRALDSGRTKTVPWSRAHRLILGR
jgi:putative addiction module component (TIGR02574 family)